VSSAAVERLGRLDRMVRFAAVSTQPLAGGRLSFGYCRAVHMERSEGEAVGGARGECRVLAGLFLLAVFVRTLAALRTSVIFGDGPIFISLANDMGRGDWAAALLHPYHPLYPAAIWGVEHLTGAPEVAGVVLSVLAGGISVVALYAFLRSAFDRRLARVGGVLLCVLPYAVRFSSDVQSDGVYLALFLWAVSQLWSSLALGSKRSAFGAGVLSALAYLTRPEGVGVLVVGLILATEKGWRREWTASLALAWSGALCAGFALIAGPYLLALRSLRGAFVLSGKKSLSGLLGLADLPWAAAAAAGALLLVGLALRVGARRRGLSGAGAPFGRAALVAVALAACLGGVLFIPQAREFSGVAFSSLGPSALLLVSLGLAGFPVAPSRPRARFLGVFLVLYALLLFGLLWNYGYLSRRHMLPPLTLLLGYAAAGVFVLARWLRRSLAHIPSIRPLSAGGSLVVVLLLVGATDLPKAWHRHREDALAHRRAAEWLRGQGEPAGSLASVKLRTAYYAGRDWVPLRPQPNGAIAPRELRRARYLIVDRETAGSLTEASTLGLKELHRVEAAGKRVFVYRILRRDS